MEATDPLQNLFGDHGDDQGGDQNGEVPTKETRNALDDTTQEQIRHLFGSDDEENDAHRLAANNRTDEFNRGYVLDDFIIIFLGRRVVVI